MKNRCVRTVDMMLLVCKHYFLQFPIMFSEAKPLTFQLNAAVTNADAVDVAFETEFVAVGAGDRVLSGCLCEGCSRGCPAAMTSRQVGI